VQSSSLRIFILITTVTFFISNFRSRVNVVFFLSGDSPASEFFVQTFRNALPSSYVALKRIFFVKTTHEDGTECSETSAQRIQTQGNHPRERIQNIVILFLFYPNILDCNVPD
jgi:hypothetical protein